LFVCTWFASVCLVRLSFSALYFAHSSRFRSPLGHIHPRALLIHTHSVAEGQSLHDRALAVETMAAAARELAFGWQTDPAQTRGAESDSGSGSGESDSDSSGDDDNGNDGALSTNERNRRIVARRLEAKTKRRHPPASSASSKQERRRQNQNHRSVNAFGPLGWSLFFVPLMVALRPADSASGSSSMRAAKPVHQQLTSLPQSSLSSSSSSTSFASTRTAHANGSGGGSGPPIAVDDATLLVLLSLEPYKPPPRTTSSPSSASAASTSASLPASSPNAPATSSSSSPPPSSSGTARVAASLLRGASALPLAAALHEPNTLASVLALVGELCVCAARARCAQTARMVRGAVELVRIAHRHDEVCGSGWVSESMRVGAEWCWWESVEIMREWESLEILIGW
jgi:hypothetical protein